MRHHSYSALIYGLVTLYTQYELARRGLLVVCMVKQQGPDSPPPCGPHPNFKPKEGLPSQQVLRLLAAQGAVYLT
jgi:hypothetical protein